MVRLSDIRIGTKLFMMSGLGVLLVAGMIVTQIHGNSAVKSANEAAATQGAASNNTAVIRSNRLRRAVSFGVLSNDMIRTSRMSDSLIPMVVSTARRRSSGAAPINRTSERA